MADRDQLSGSSVFDEARGSLQETAKWIVAAAAVVGGALLAGLQLKDIGPMQEDSPLQLLASIGGFAVGLLGVGSILVAAARVLTTQGVTLSSLSRREVQVMTEHPSLAPGQEISDFDPLLCWINERRTDLLPDGLGSIGDVRKKKRLLEEALSDARRGRSAIVDDVTYDRGDRDAVSQLTARLQDYNAKIDMLIDAAQMYLVHSAYRKLIRALWRGGILVSVGILSFTFATAKSRATPAPAVAAPTQVEVVIKAHPAAALKHAHLPPGCAGRILTGMAVAGTFEHDHRPCC